MGTKTITLIILGVLVLFSIVSLILVKVLYDAQFQRFDLPDERLTTALRYSDYEEKYPRELVTFKSGSNTLQGYIYGKANDKGLVVIAHGLGGGADSYLGQTTYFVDQGWCVFTYDATGSYRSEGKSTKGFPQSVLDLDAALRYIETHPELNNLPVFLFGHSWGGYAVCNVLHYDHQIAGVVSVAGVNSAMEIVIEQGRSLLGNFIYIQYPFLWLYQRLLFGNVLSFSAVDAINKSQTPVLIIHGTDDKEVAYDGSSIISKLDQITNPNVTAITLDEVGRNGHNNIFRSHQALHYVTSIQNELNSLYEEYQQDIPEKIKVEFFANIDRARAQELNSELMNQINDFLDQCLEIESGRKINAN
ncbi:MAG: alpha/beta fold hydrolase [Firmicutes bacterium]|nr:alpha/beta fold hydrolase [Bacillota bacterium]